MLLNDKVAIVTGGGSGIGEATSIRFSREGAAVLVADMRFRKAEAVANQNNDEGGHATAIEVDVSIAESVEALVDKTLSQYGRLDVMFNNAGTLRPGSVVDLEVDDWDLVMGVNVRSVFLGGKFAIPAMLSSGGGSIINTASISGLYGDGGAVAYAASKAAVINLTRAMSTDHARDGIRINAICPGTIETPSLHERMDSMAEKLGSKKAAEEWFVSRQPMGRLGQPDEIASLIIYLLSDAGSYATGQPFIVDGGTIA